MQLKKKKACAVYGEGAVTDGKEQKWFVKFHAGNFSLEDALQSGRPAEEDSDQMQTMRTINFIPRKRQPTYSEYPSQPNENQLGYVSCFDVWVPNKLRKKNKKTS